MTRDTASLGRFSNHETGDILKEYQRDTALTAQFNKVRPFDGAFRKENTIVGDDPHGDAMDMRKAANQRFAELRFELIKARSIHSSRDDLTDVIGFLRIGGHDAHDLGRIIGRCFGRAAGDRGLGLDTQIRHDTPRDLKGMCIVFGQMVGDT